MYKLFKNAKFAKFNSLENFYLYGINFVLHVGRISHTAVTQWAIPFNKHTPPMNDQIILVKNLSVHGVKFFIN